MRHHGSACVLGLGRNKERVCPVRFCVTGGYLKHHLQGSLYCFWYLHHCAKAPVSVKGCVPGSSQDGARTCLWALISSPLSFLGRLDPGGGPPACVPAAMVRPSPDTAAWRYFTLSHMHPLLECLRVGIPGSPLVSPLALSTT